MTGEVSLLTSDNSWWWDNWLMQGVHTPSGIFTFALRSHLSNALNSGVLAENVPIVEMDMTPNDQLILCSDGVWEAITAEDEKVKSTLAEIDARYEAVARQGYREDPAKIAIGEQFRQINLAGLPEGASHNQIVSHLTRKDVGLLGKDNVTAVVMEVTSPTPSTRRVI